MLNSLGDHFGYLPFSYILIHHSSTKFYSINRATTNIVCDPDNMTKSTKFDKHLLLLLLLYIKGEPRAKYVKKMPVKSQLYP